MHTPTTGWEDFMQRWGLLAANQLCNGFDVEGVRKHINGLDFRHQVILTHGLHIPCQGSRIAGEIYNPIGAQFHDTGEDIFMHACPRRIDDEYIRPQIYRGHFFPDISQYKPTIWYPIRPAVSLCVSDSALHDLYAHNVFHMA